MPTESEEREIATMLVERGLSGSGEPPPVTRLAAYGVIRQADRILLCRVAPGYAGTGLWTLPGGGIEFGEAPDSAALREVEEETGLVARITGQPAIHSDTGVWPRAVGQVRFHHVRFIYPMEIAGGSERREVNGSTDEIGWFTPGELGALRLGDLVERVLRAETPA